MCGRAPLRLKAKSADDVVIERAEELQEVPLAGVERWLKLGDQQCAESPRDVRRLWAAPGSAEFRFSCHSD